MVWDIRIRELFVRSVSLVQIVLIMLAAMAIAFWMGTKSTSLPFLGNSVFSEVPDKKEAIRLLEKSNGRLKNEVALAKRTAEVESIAVEKMKIMLWEKDAELLKLTQELQFYHTLYSPGADNTAVQVKAFQLRAKAATGQFVYSLILTGMPKKEEKVSGVIGLSMTGEQQGVPKVLVLEAIHGTGEDEALRFSFRYFQEITGSISLPEGFSPGSVQVELLRDGRKKEPLVASYRWDEIYKPNEFHPAWSEE